MARERRNLSILAILRLYSMTLLLLTLLPVLLYLLAPKFGEWGADLPLHQLLFFGAFLAVTLAAAAGEAIVHAILAPLRLLVEGAERIRNGDYGHTIDLSETPHAPREFRQLMNAFNSMSLTVKRHVEIIEATSRTDQLTGLSNRRHLMAEGYRLVSVALRAGTPCASLMADIDFFKRVNDTYGHPVGDKYLIHIAGCIASAVRESDMVARYGGEEFVVLAPNATLAQARSLAERIRKTVAGNPLRIGPILLNNTVSIGVAEYDEDPQFGSNILEDMIAKADKALYQAKQQGRNCVRTWPLSDEPGDAASCAAGGKDAGAGRRTTGLS